MTTYKDSGVDIDVAEKAKARIKELVKGTLTADSFVKPGFFCGGIRLNLNKYREPVLMLSADGVGTKLMVARMMNKYDTVGIDLVNHCANDILTSGAKPLFFLDYIASGKIDQDIAPEIVKGVAEACKKLGITLAGGETAQMPGVYVKGENDIAGVIGGLVEESEIIDGSRIAEGDALIGVASTGLHTNGYSLARKVLFEMAGYKPGDYIKELNSTIGEALLEPHREYVGMFLGLEKKFIIKGIAHITGGGITDNLPRILPEGVGAKIITKNWEVPPIFRLLQKKGGIPDSDMMRTFNMGIGIILAVDKRDAAGMLAKLRQMKEKAWIIGETASGNGVKYAED
ncbi:phosphoribosylformylglycinamidine cyclo-ligase [Candidatus Woesearchaeota archaeon]|nr:phosphoribosylformylglycinamidine cyclo-ligase [Candidatus Woesearchaeota archaeon]